VAVVGQDTLWYRIGRAIGDAVRPRRDPTRTGRRPGPAPTRQQGRGRAAGGGEDYPGDFEGRFDITYAPNEDALADPGEVVWTWVPYEEDHTQGKDRPVLIVGRDDPWLLGLPLSSKDHQLDAAQEAAEGRYWVEIGTGEWDRSGRQSAVRVNRVVRVDPGGVRRIGARLDKWRFQLVADAVQRHAAPAE
jgi:hypothetical protein